MNGNAGVPAEPGNEERDRRIAALEEGLLSQEHRFLTVLYNFFVLRRTFPQDDPRRAACTRALLWRLFSPQVAAGASVGIVAVLGAVFAWQANALLARQNEKIDMQNQLAEASRRATLIFELTSINERMDAIRKETDVITLPESLIGRIVALSRSLRPYLFIANATDDMSVFGPAYKGTGLACSNLTGNSDEAETTTVGRALFFDERKSAKLIERPVSPERGQLLITLSSASIANFDKLIGAGLDLRYSDLRGSSIKNARLQEAELQFSDFRGADLFLTDLSQADVSGARFDCSSLIGINLSQTRSAGASFQEARLNKANLTSAFLGSANFSRAFISDAIFADATLEDVNLEGSILCQADAAPPAECTNWLINLSKTAKGFDANHWRLVKEKVTNHPWADATSFYLVVHAVGQ